MRANLRTLTLLAAMIASLTLPGTHAWAVQDYTRTIVVDFDDFRLLLLDEDGRELQSFPVVLPRKTPQLPVEGVVQAVIVNPWWYPTQGTRKAYFQKYGVELPERIPPGNPQNAMGAIKVVVLFTTEGANPTIRIHGTNAPEYIEQRVRVSRGCIRMYNEDALALASAIEGHKT